MKTPRHRFRRPRARHRMAARAIAPGLARLRRARQRRHGARGRPLQRGPHGHRRARRVRARTKASTRRWSGPRGRSPRASSMPSATRACASSGRRRPPRSSSRPRISPSTSCSATAFPPRATRPSPTRRPRTPTSTQHGAPIVIKADGLAAGKGVVVATTAEEAHDAIDMMLAGNKLGDAGHRVVIEEFMAGEEASFIVMVDGKNVLPLASSQDHKRIFDGDQGPNTGGMGAYSPAPVVTPEVHARVMREIILPTVKGMADDGIAVHGLPLRGPHDRQGGRAARGGIQLPPGRPGDAADLHAPEERLLRARRARDRRHARPGRGQWDRRAALGVVLAAAAIPTRRARATRSRAAEGRGGLPRVPRGHGAEGRQGRDERRARALRDGARRQGEDRRRARLRGRGAHPLRRHAVSARTSATAPSARR